MCQSVDERGGDDDLSIHELLVELGVLSVLIRGSDQGVSLVLEPLADTQLVLGRAYHRLANECEIWEERTYLTAQETPRRPCHPRKEP